MVLWVLSWLCRELVDYSCSIRSIMFQCFSGFGDIIFSRMLFVMLGGLWALIISTCELKIDKTNDCKNLSTYNLDTGDY